MENVKEILWECLRSWSTTLASLLPLWLLSFAIMAEGFPQPPISAELASISFVLAISVSIVLLQKRWMTVQLLLYSFIPSIFLFTFDEISTTYKSPFIILCSLILTAGAVGYQRSRAERMGWFIILSTAIVTLLAASHSANRFWDMVGDLGYERCFPDAQGCAPLTGQENPWWTLFFGL